MKCVMFIVTYNKATHDSLVTEFAGVPETMKTLKEAGFKMGIVTSKMSRCGADGNGSNENHAVF